MFKKLFVTYVISIIVICLVISHVPLYISLAGTNEAKWSPVPMPGDGEASGWQLAAGAYIKKCLTVACDGTLYCYANPESTINTLFKSTDGGLSWSATGQVRDTIIAMATVPNDASTLYYATDSMVYRSSDAGISFIPLPPNPGGAGSDNIFITSLAATRTGSSNLVAVGTRDTDFGNYGGVYFLDESSPSGFWQNTGIGANNVYQLAFSPDYLNDGLLVAVTGNATDAHVMSKIAGGGWGQTIGNACLPSMKPASAAVSFPPDYTAMSSFFLSINTGTSGGDVYRISPEYAPLTSIATALGVGATEGMSSVDISSLAMTGDTNTLTLVAGCADQARTYVSFDNGVHWIRSQKSPAGQSDTCVVTCSDYTGYQDIHAVTCGTDSAFSVSRDNGVTWEQTSLIDSQITGLVDLAVVPAEPTSVLFMITHDGTSLKHTLWKSQDDGNRWQNLFSSSLPGNSFHMVETVGEVNLFLAGQNNGSPALWYSDDGWQSFTLYSVPCHIDAWAFINANTFFIGGYDGTGGVVYRTDNGGISYSIAGRAGTRTITDIAISPDYMQDSTLVVGNTGGQAFISHDAGGSFQALGQQLPVFNGTGKVNLALDENFTGNGVVYAAVDTKTNGADQSRIFYLTIGTSSAWQSMYDSLPENTVISRIMITNNGAFYAVNGQGVVSADNKGGLLRVLPPASQSAFEIAVRGLDEGATLNGLWTGKNRFWTFNSKSMTLMTMVDNLTAPVILESPLDIDAGISTDIRLEWQPVTGATEYEWQINDEQAFSSIPDGFSGRTTIAGVQLAALKPATTYYWRVRVIKPLNSPWSSIHSFTTLIGGMNISPELTYPAAGSTVDISPVFHWNTVPNADRYELLVADDTSFAVPIISCTGNLALLTNAWQCEIDLKYDTGYFWKVRACTADNFGEWSAVNVFTTETAPSPAGQGIDSASQEQSSIQPDTVAALDTRQQPPSTTNTIQMNIPDWVLYTGLTILIVIALLLVILIMLNVASRRLRK